MNNGQIITVDTNFIMQSLTNNTPKKGDLFIGQQYVPVHKNSFSPLIIKKTIPTNHS